MSSLGFKCREVFLDDFDIWNEICLPPLVQQETPTANIIIIRF